jgi:hypothetical protein
VGARSSRSRAAKCPSLHRLDRAPLTTENRNLKAKLCHMELHTQDAIAFAGGMPRQTRNVLDKILQRRTRTKHAGSGTLGRTVTTRHDDEPVRPEARLIFRAHRRRGICTSGTNSHLRHPPEQTIPPAIALITDFSRGVTRYHAPPGCPAAG